MTFFVMPRGRWRALACCATLTVSVAAISGERSSISVDSAPRATTDNDRMSAALGKALFKRVWVPAPSSTKANDGLGPLFNGRSCLQCHAAAGAGRLVVDDMGHLAERGAVVRLSTPEGHGDPIYGTQIQTRAAPGLEAEASVYVRFQPQTETFDDGETIVLRRPIVELKNLSNGELQKATDATLIIAPSLQTAARIAMTERNDAVFGLKGTASSLEEMTSLAFLRDLGLSTPRFPSVAGDCTSHQQPCLAAPHGETMGGAEISAEIVAAIAHYITTLDDASASPAPADRRGAAVFEQTGCATCHRPAQPGRDGKAVSLYSDLQLHDMGAALAGLTEANGQSRDVWRTAPLIHIQSRLKAGATLLHDGRAQTVAEAILWHGGAAQEARNAYKALSKDDRAALENYVSSR